MDDKPQVAVATPRERITTLLGGDAFLVPCGWGTKTPIVTYKDRPLAGTKTPAYLAVLDGGETNLAVYLGHASGGLCAVDFDGEEDLAAFLAVNPKLAPSLRSRAARGAQIWLRIAGDFPRSAKASHFEWRADGNLSTIFGRHKKGMDFGEPELGLASAGGVRPTLFIHARCTRLLETLPALQHDPHRPEDVLKVDADEDGVGGDDAADCLRYLVGTKARTVVTRKLRGV